MHRTIPFPPPPEPGWYEDDAVGRPAQPPVRAAGAELEHEGNVRSAQTVHELVDDIESVADEPLDAEALDGDGSVGPLPVTGAADRFDRTGQDGQDNQDGQDGVFPSGFDGDPEDGTEDGTEGAYPATVTGFSAQARQTPHTPHTVPMTVRTAADSATAHVDDPAFTDDPLTGDARSTLPRRQGDGQGTDGLRADDAVANPSAGAAAQSDTTGQPHASPRHTRTYLMRNDTTGQSIVVDASMLLGRRPSNPVPDGAKVVQVEDPTRTISRNHATLTMDENDRLWLDDCDSLNGTYLVVAGHDVKVDPGSPAEVTAPAVIRLGDQLFELREMAVR